MFKLYFNNRYNEDSFVAELSSDKYEEVAPIIKSHVANLNPKYEIHYIRYWTEDNGVIWYDVGSHSEFFKLVKE